MSLLTFARYRTGPSGSRLLPQSTPKCVLAALMHFAVLSARSTLDRTTPHRSRGRCSPLSRFTEVLLRRLSSVRPLPRATPCSARVLREHPSLVPSSRSLTASMACSARSLAGLLHPASGHEVRRVSRFRHPLDSRPSDHRRVSHDATPLEGFPLSKAVPHHCDRSLLDLCTFPCVGEAPTRRRSIESPRHRVRRSKSPHRPHTHATLRWVGSLPKQRGLVLAERQPLPSELYNAACSTGPSRGARQACSLRKRFDHRSGP